MTAGLAGVLDDAAYAGGATSTVAGTFVFSGGNLTWTGNLASGQSTTISYAVTVADPDTGNHLLSTSVSSPAPGSSCTGSAPCTNVVTVLTPGLAVSTTATPATTTPGGQVSFTITLQNTGQTAYVATTVTTGLSQVLDDATFDGTVRASSGVATYAAPTLSWTGNLAVGATVTITYTVVVRAPDPGDRTLSTTVVADQVGSSCRTGSPAPSCTAVVTVLIPALTIAKVASVATTTPGGTVGYTITITNSGQTAYTGAVVSDTLSGLLSDATYNNDAAVTAGGALTYTAPTLRWTGDLPVGGVATLTYSITVLNPDPGDKVLTNGVVSTTPGSTCPTATAAPACSTQVRVLVPALGITQTADATTVVAGGSVGYTVLVENTGEVDYAAATFNDSLAAILDDATYAGGAVATRGAVTYSSGTLVWTGALAVGQTATITFSVTTTYPALGDKTLSSTVLSATLGSTCVTGTRARCRTAVTVLVPALSISKTASATAIVAGGTLDYSILATNTGQAPYPAASLVDSLAGVLDDAVYAGNVTASLGTVSVTGNQLTWNGALPAGAAVLITYSVTVDVVDPGDAVLRNAVTSTTVGSRCPTGGSDPACSTTTTVTPGTLALVGLTPSFTLTGPADSTATLAGAVGMTVRTNNFGGYTVTVQGSSPALTGRAGNADTIPIGRLAVRPSGSGPFVPLSSTTPLVVHSQRNPSAPGGDAVGNDYRVQIPFVAADTYATELEYIVTTQ